MLVHCITCYELSHIVESYRKNQDFYHWYSARCSLSMVFILLKIKRMDEKMKKLFVLTLAIVMAVALVSCTQNNVQENNDELVIKVGMECNYAPFNWSQTEETEGSVAIANVENMYTNGYDVQIAKMIADKIGAKLEIYAYEWDSLVPAVQSGALDLIIAGMSPTADRWEKVDFSDNYYNSNLVVITKKGNLEDVKTIADLDGKKIAAQSGTFHITALETQTNAIVSELSDFTTMLIALDAGTIDGYIAEEPTAMSVATDDSAYSFVALVNNDTGFTTEAGDTAIAVGIKKNSELLSKVNAALEGFDSQAQSALMAQMVEIAPVD